MRATSLSISLAVVAAAVLAMSVARPAYAACTCVPQTPDFLLPRDGATGVPRNVRILVSAGRIGASQWAATDASAVPPPLRLAVVTGAEHRPGAAVKAVVSSMLSEGYGTVFVMRPAKILAARTTYGLLLEEQGAGLRLIGTFTTGAVEDKLPPAFAGIDRLTAVVSFRPAMNACDGESPFEELTWGYGAASDDAAPPTDLVRLLYVQKKGEPRILKLVEPFDVPTAVTSVNGSQCDAVKPRMKVGDEVCATVEVVDLAGNAAGSAVEKCMVAKRM